MSAGRGLSVTAIGSISVRAPVATAAARFTRLDRGAGDPDSSDEQSFVLGACPPPYCVVTSIQVVWRASVMQTAAILVCSWWYSILYLNVLSNP